jgi:hypothetical protein
MCEYVKGLLPRRKVTGLRRVGKEVLVDGRVWRAHKELHEDQKSHWPGCLRIRYY